MTSLESPTVRARSDAPSLRPAAYALFVLLVASQLAIVAFSQWAPSFGGTLRYDDIAPAGDAYWPMNVLLEGPGYALGAVASSVFLAVLGAGRGQVAALTGAGVHLVGGTVFALVITAEVLPFVWAADPAIVGEAQGRALFDAYNDSSGAFLPYVIGSMAVVALGALLAMTGAAISGRLAWWVPAVALALIVGVFALPPGHPLGVVVDLGVRVLWIYIGWRGLRVLTDRA